MRVEVVAVGKVRNGALRELCDDYSARCRRYLELEVIEVRESRREIARALREEAEAMQRAATPGYWIALDERGASWRSVELADKLEGWMMRAVRSVSLFIGSARGLDASLLDACDTTLRLSAMTLPHEMARMLLLEQLYRANTIVRGEPYHKA